MIESAGPGALMAKGATDSESWLITKSLCSTPKPDWRDVLKITN